MFERHLRLKGSETREKNVHVKWVREGRSECAEVVWAFGKSEGGKVP